MQMAGRKPVKPSPKKQTFFKVLSDDFSEFSQHLRIPPEFVKNFKGKSLRKCVLRGPSGTWDVELERRENGLFFHDHGWQSFVEDHVLEVGDFLVFSYDGKSNFNVTIFDPSCCEKDVEAAKRRSAGRPISSANKGNQAREKMEIVEPKTENYDCENETRIADKRSCHPVMSEKRHEKGHVEETSEGSMVFKSEFSCFIATMKKHMKYRVMIPKGIAITEGLMRKKSSVILEDPTGRSWIIKLRYGGESDRNRLLMTKGWVECCKVNQISHGDTVVFEFVKQGVLQIHIFKAGDESCPVALAVAPDLKN